jgi:hypothetical protein
LASEFIRKFENHLFQQNLVVWWIRHWIGKLYDQQFELDFLDPTTYQEVPKSFNSTRALWSSG